MPKKGKKPRPLKPYQKMQLFLDTYEATCARFDISPIPEIKEIYDPLIVKKSKKFPQIIQFADITVEPEKIRPFIETLKKSEVRVKILSFLNSNTGDLGFGVLGHALDEPLEIAGVAYHANGVGPSGCRQFARHMVNSKSLAILELDFNTTMGDLGVASLCHYGHCPTMTRLSLKFCDIADDGAAALANWIALDTCNLKELYLNGNKICPPGIIKFAEGLGRNKSLTRVELQDNLFGYDLEALNAMHDGIMACPTLQYINMLNNFEVPEGIPEKYTELVKNKPLGECVLSIKMDTFFFQNMRAFSLINKRKMIKEAKKAAKEARKAAKAERASPRSNKAVGTPEAPTTDAPQSSAPEAPATPAPEAPATPAPDASATPAPDASAPTPEPDTVSTSEKTESSANP